MNEKYLGACLSLNKSNMMNTVDSALSINANSFMFYWGSPTTFKKPDSDYSLIAKGIKYANENNIKTENIVLHTSYLANFASPEVDKRNMAMNLLAQEINFANEIGIKYLICHPGSYTTGNRPEGLKFAVDCINTVLEESDSVVVCFETMGGKGKEIGVSIEEMQYLIQNVKLQDKIGFCFDTCHAWDSGIDLNNIDTVLEMIDNSIGLDYLKVVHLNGSLNKMGSKKDRHANIFNTEFGINQIGENNLKNIFLHEKLKDKIFILETPEVPDRGLIYQDEIEFLRGVSL